MPQQPYTILSVGGSIVIPPGGFDIPFLKNFRDLILDEVKNGKKFILVVGGGATCRTYQNAARELGEVTNEDLDWIGIKTTHANAEMVRFLFKGHVADEVVANPTKKLRTKASIIIAAGWKPGCSTDNDAVLLAKTYGAKQIFNLSNVDYVYDSDPRTNPAAKKIERTVWKEFRKIVGDEWSPGANVPFDPTAAKMAEKMKLIVGFVKGTDLNQVKMAITGAKFQGSIVTP